MGLRDRLTGRRESDAFDPHELGARRSDPTLAALEPIPALWSDRMRPRNLLLGFAALVVVAAIVRSGGPGGGPKLATSCTKGGFVLSKTEVGPYGVIAWSATGPNGTRVLFALDSPTAPSLRSAAALAAPGPLHGCRASGRFGVRAKEGDHVVTVFGQAPDGTTTRIGTAKVTVTS